MPKCGYGLGTADGEPESHEEVDDFLSLMFGYRAFNNK